MCVLWGLGVLRQAVMALPSQDYELCRKMIPEKIQAEEPFVSLNALVACMTHAKFKEFWTQYATMKDSLDAGALRRTQTRQLGAAMRAQDGTQRLPRSALAAQRPGG